MRLDRFISNASDYSRSQVKQLLRAGLVEVNGLITTNAATQVAEGDTISVDGFDISTPSPRYLMLHKPAGVVSVTKDSEHPTALDLLDEPRPEQLQIAGRLDIDTTGLLLITDDGQWNHRITSPRSHCRKTYRVELAEPLNTALVKKFADGLWLEGEKRRCLPAELEITGEHSALLTISEGKYHQVKRMFAAVGNRVTGLHRQKVGQIELDPRLAPGEYRPLTPDEIDSVNTHE
ncbi:MAG: 16S rRNA pseudouridine(516) synthase RsuA [Gammaproteobacteria bacterium]|nr:MAG: 16S rRNA pseudouridine(516) synthase RsuA [Gammaproteobacteria bacterium]